MADRHSAAVRRKNMAAIKGKNTKPELMVRRGLHARGFRYSLHRKDLPGKPDMTLPKYNAVIFVNGCFWHGHNCKAFSWPKTRQAFWREKISRTVERDNENAKLLIGQGWRVATIWECALKGPNKLGIDNITQELSEWLYSEDEVLTIGVTDKTVLSCS